MISKPMRDKVLKRDDGQCWHCGETEAISIQHRANRGMGGSKLRDRLDNLMVLCSAMNLAIESDSVQAGYARDYGWKLNSWDDYSKPVFDNQRSKWFNLNLDGSKSETEAPSYLI